MCYFTAVTTRPPRTTWPPVSTMVLWWCRWRLETGRRPHTSVGTSTMIGQYTRPTDGIRHCRPWKITARGKERRVGGKRYEARTRGRFIAFPRHLGFFSLRNDRADKQGQSEACLEITKTFRFFPFFLFRFLTIFWKNM